uniref:Transporter n=1 Tax=Desulfobacca acetoxidans TaxID=60893 RepID=A0A7V4LDR1_9BACT
MVGEHAWSTRRGAWPRGIMASVLLITAMLAAGAESGWGAGFALTQQGTAAMAQGNAFVAEANDPSAIFYNPAGLTQINKFAFYSGTVFNYPSRWYEGDRGYESQTHHRYYHTSQVFLSVPLQERVALGLGFFTPFGLGTAWPPEWAGRYITFWSKLKTYDLNPVVAVKLLDNLSIGGGVCFLWSDVRLKRKIPVIIKGYQFPDAESDLQGKGNGIGGNFGILYEPVKGVKLGAAYRSHIYVEHQGNLVISRLPRFLPFPRNSEGSAGLTYPATVQFGVSVNRFAPFTFNLDATWTQWSSYDKLAVNLDRPMFISGRFTNVVVNEKNWVDAWAFRLGMNYKLNENMTLRAGYAYDMTPVPRSSFEPQLPDGNRHIFAIGGDLKIWKLNLSWAYNYILFEGRAKNNYFATNGVPLPPALQANGKYDADTHSLGLSTTFYW